MAQANFRTASLDKADLYSHDLILFRTVASVLL